MPVDHPSIPVEPGDQRDRRWRPARLIAVLAVVGVVLMLVGIALWNAYEYFAGDGLAWRVVGVASRMLYPGREGNITTWYSALLLSAVALGLAAHAVLLRGAGRGWRAYAALAAIALLLSADEAASMHEQLNRLAEFLEVGGTWTFAWVVLGIPLVVVSVVIILWLARRVDRRLRPRLMVAGATFLIGALGFEVLGGMIVAGGEVTSNPVHVVAYQAVQLLEEGLEVAGALLALWATLDALDVSVGDRGLLIRSRVSPLDDGLPPSANAG